MTGRDYLAGIETDPADFEATQAHVGDPTEDDFGTVFINYIDTDQDHWTAVWQRGSEARSFDGARADAIAWGLGQRASQYWLFDPEMGDYVPLKSLMT